MLFVAHEFVGATAVGPGLDEVAVALDSAREVLDGYGVVAIGEELEVAPVVPSLFVVGIDVENLLVNFFGFFGLVEVLIVHGHAVEGVGVFGVKTEGCVEVFDGQRVMVVGIEHAELFEGRSVVGVEVTDFAQQEYGVSGIGGLFIDEAFHEEGGTVLGVFGSDLAEVLHSSVVVTAVVSYLAQLEESLLVVGVEFQGALKALVAVLYVSVGKVGIAEEGVVFELLVVDGDGSGKIGNSIVHAVELEVDFGSVVIEVVIFGMLVDFDVEHVENVLIGHVFCGGAVVATGKCRKERQEKDEYKGLMFH